MNAKQIVKRWLTPLCAARAAVVRTGLSRSVREGSSVDAEGQPVPWYTYPAISYLDLLEFDGRRVFEWGMGSSTAYWERRGCTVTGVEHDPRWHRDVSTSTGANCILATDRASYVAAPEGLFDVVCIDGRHRPDCAAVAPDHVAEGGMIVLDNSDRHPDVCAGLRGQGWSQVDFLGLGPLNPYMWMTSMFLRDGLGIPHRVVVPADY